MRKTCLDVRIMLWNRVEVGNYLEVHLSGLQKPDFCDDSYLPTN